LNIVLLIEVGGEVKIEQCTYYTKFITSIHFFLIHHFQYSIEMHVQMALNLMKYLIEKLTIELDKVKV